MGSQALAIPKIDFSGLMPGSTAGWDAIQGEVLQALETYGCFEALYDGVPPKILETLFDRTMPEVFSLPIENKKRVRHSDLPFHGYTDRLADFAFESLVVGQRYVEQSARLMWPQGNPSFCDTVSAYINHLKDLEQITVQMVFRSLGVEKNYESYIESTEYGIRLGAYGVPFNEANVSLIPHFDPNFVSIIRQHRVDGLEVQTKEGEWIRVVPELNSYTVMIGEAFEAWSNGRLQAPLHRVTNFNNEKRNSVLFTSCPKECIVIEAPKELVDEEHPLLYKPYTNKDYLKFRFGDGGVRARKTLKDFCGASGEKARA